MEHPQTVLLTKVLESNASLGGAHLNKSDPSTVLNRWMELQKSVSLLFDNKSSGKSFFGLRFVYLVGMVTCGAGCSLVGL